MVEFPQQRSVLSCQEIWFLIFILESLHRPKGIVSTEKGGESIGQVWGVHELKNESQAYERPLIFILHQTAHTQHISHPNWTFFLQKFGEK